MAQPVTKHHRPKTQFFSTLLGCSLELQCVWCDGRHTGIRSCLALEGRGHDQALEDQRHRHEAQRCRQGDEAHREPGVDVGVVREQGVPRRYAGRGHRNHRDVE